MTLFVSDMHLGRGTPEEERAEERELVAFLGRYAGHARRLCLVGDVFDHFIEYHRLVCKGFVRFQATLAAWADRGMDVIYVVGNHDPWHRDYFAAELGIRLVKGSLLQDLDGTVTYVHHGSGLTPRGRMVQNVLRHPLPVWGYRTLLPASAGVGLASWVSRLRRHGVPDAQSIGAAREHARHILATTDARLAVLGHTHQAELCQLQGGVYLNSGAWRVNRTFGTLAGTKIQLHRWNGRQAIIVEERELPTSPNAQDQEA